MVCRFSRKTHGSQSCPTTTFWNNRKNIFRGDLKEAHSWHSDPHSYRTINWEWGTSEEHVDETSSWAGLSTSPKKFRGIGSPSETSESNGDSSDGSSPRRTSVSASKSASKFAGTAWTSGGGAALRIRSLRICTHGERELCLLFCHFLPNFRA